mmetsp:Transcript_36091/g.75194  ORF Transcript_36091/g.75194 Transcript_36091/m.75194 type:complete len:203 (+) Transcript_36091:3-611(+)
MIPQRHRFPNTRVRGNVLSGLIQCQRQKGSSLLLLCRGLGGVRPCQLDSLWLVLQVIFLFLLVTHIPHILDAQTPLLQLQPLVTLVLLLVLLLASFLLFEGVRILCKLHMVHQSQSPLRIRVGHVLHEGQDDLHHCLAASQRVALRCLQGALEEALVEEMHLLTVVLGHEVLQTSVQLHTLSDLQMQVADGSGLEKCHALLV